MIIKRENTMTIINDHKNVLVTFESRVNANLFSKAVNGFVRQPEQFKEVTEKSGFVVQFNLEALNAVEKSICIEFLDTRLAYEQLKVGVDSVEKFEELRFKLYSKFATLVHVPL